MSPQKKAPAAWTNWWVDLILLAAVLLALAPALTGLAVHEWLSLALAAALVIHLLLHWTWIVTVLRRFFGRLSSAARINLILNSLLFIDLTVITFTGLAVSRVALPLVGWTLPRSGLWTGLHRLSADLSVWIVGLHLAVHWKWIVSTTRRYIWQPLLFLGQPARPAAKPEAEA